MNLPVPGDPAGRTYDTILVRGNVIYAAEWDPETEQAMPLTDEDGEYIEVSANVVSHFFLTPQEVAAATGTSDSQWRNKAAAGEIPGAIKKGKQWLLPRSVLNQ